jgi:hypothetical protein
VRRAVLLVFATACVAESSLPPGESHSIQFDWPGGYAPQADLLFVVDNTSAMTPYHQKLLDLGPYTASALRHYSAGMPDVHVGVVDTSGGTIAFLSDIHNNDGSRTTSYTGELGDAIAALLDIQPSSSAPPQPLATIERALSDTDFIRPDTSFMAVTISADDDHSLAGVDHYIDVLKALPRGRLATGIFPAQAPRLEAFHAAFDPFGKGIHVPLDGEWGRSLSPITDIIIDGIEPCFYDERPVEPYECAISMFDKADHETVLPPCATTPTGACWEIHVDNQCFSDSGLGLTIDVRGYAHPYRPHLIGECVTQ